MKKILSMMLVVVMALGLAVPALAAGPTFSDVPETHWAYADVETAAAEGLMKGTGGDLFSPDMKVSVAQFLTLVGRVVFPDVKAEGEDWAGPYIAAAQTGGLLTGTQVDVSKPEAEISRYDMAVILRAAAKQLGVAEKAAQSSEVADYGVIPNMYTDAVLAVYGMGLIKGDQAGNFNGSNTMMRSEVVTVVVRLFKLKPGSGTSGQPTEPEKPDETEPPSDPEKPVEMKTMKLSGWIQYGSKGDPQKNGIGVVGVPFELRYTEDNGKTYTVIGEGVTGNDARGKSPGRFDLTVQVEKTVFDKSWNGDGQIYISAETSVNGQKYVTQDRRTDGSNIIAPIGTTWSHFFVDLVPPDQGETVEVKLYGFVTANTGGWDSEGHLQMRSHTDTITNSTVRVYYAPQAAGSSPVLLWETNADGGVIDDVMIIDTAYYRTTGDCYVVEIEAELDGQLCTDHRGQQKPINLDQLSGAYPSTIIRRFIDSDQYADALHFSATSH